MQSILCKKRVYLWHSNAEELRPFWLPHVSAGSGPQITFNLWQLLMTKCQASSNPASQLPVGLQLTILTGNKRWSFLAAAAGAGAGSASERETQNSCSSCLEKEKPRMFIDCVTTTIYLHLSEKLRFALGRLISRPDWWQWNGKQSQLISGRAEWGEGGGALGAWHFQCGSSLEPSRSYRLACISNLYVNQTNVCG